MFLGVVVGRGGWFVVASVDCHGSWPWWGWFCPGVGVERLPWFAGRESLSRKRDSIVFRLPGQAILPRKTGQAFARGFVPDHIMRYAVESLVLQRFRECRYGPLHRVCEGVCPGRRKRMVVGLPGQGFLSRKTWQTFDARAGTDSRHRGSWKMACMAHWLRKL